MKVIQVMDNFIIGGGVNSFVYDLCFALKEKNQEVTLIGILKEGYQDNPVVEELRKAGIYVICLGALSKKDAIIHYTKQLREIISELSDGKTTICNLHLKLSVLMGVIATIGLANIKCVETYHNTYHFYHLQCWFCSPFIKKYICVSETAKEEMHLRFKTPYKKIVAIPNGVSRNKVRALAKIDDYEPRGEKIHIVSVGRLSYEKNFIIPVKAFLSICNENIEYTLVGGGPQEEEIRAIASSNPYIILTGALSREKTLQILAKADIVVMPSLWEGRSILQLETMALDKPMILSDVPGLREPFQERALSSNELFRTCDFGFLVRTSDVESYRAAIRTFTENRKRIDYTIIKEISERNDLMQVAMAYIALYKDVIEGN